MILMQQLMHRQHQRFIDRGSEMMFPEDRDATACPEFLVMYGKVERSIMA